MQFHSINFLMYWFNFISKLFLFYVDHYLHSLPPYLIQHHHCVDLFIQFIYLFQMLSFSFSTCYCLAFYFSFFLSSHVKIIRLLYFLYWCVCFLKIIFLYLWFFQHFVTLSFKNLAVRMFFLFFRFPIHITSYLMKLYIHIYYVMIFLSVVINYVFCYII